MDEKNLRKSLINPILEWAKSNQKSEKHRVAKLFTEKSVSFAEAPADEPEETVFEVPAQFNGKDYITMLLHIDAEIEHGLMLQYLYSAYSIGGPQIPDAYRESVHNWKNIILGIAKEEMGHFISVQNVLKIIGAPLNFGRESYP